MKSLSRRFALSILIVAGIAAFGKAGAEILHGVVPYDSLGEIKKKFPNGKFVRVPAAWVAEGQDFWSMTGSGFSGILYFAFTDYRPLNRKAARDQCNPVQMQLAENVCQMIQKIAGQSDEDGLIVSWVRWVPPSPLPMDRYRLKYGEPTKFGLDENTMEPNATWEKAALTAQISDDKKSVFFVTTSFTKQELSVEMKRKFGHSPEVSGDSLPANPKSVVSPATTTFAIVPLTEQEIDSLKDSVTTMSTTYGGNRAPPIPTFSDTNSRLSYLRWLSEMDKKIQASYPDVKGRWEVLQTIWYESKRSGLNTALVLSVIATASKFKNIEHAGFGTSGYMGVNTEFAQMLGTTDAKQLLHLQSNLRYGCSLLRVELDRHEGSLSNALADYYEENMNANSKQKEGSRKRFVDDVLKGMNFWTAKVG
jgi:hypothetical protein